MKSRDSDCLGAGGRRFKSSRPDQILQQLTCFSLLIALSCPHSDGFEHSAKISGCVSLNPASWIASPARSTDMGGKFLCGTRSYQDARKKRADDPKAVEESSPRQPSKDPLHKGRRSLAETSCFYPRWFLARPTRPIQTTSARQILFQRCDLPVCRDVRYIGAVNVHSSSGSVFSTWRRPGVYTANTG